MRKRVLVPSFSLLSLYLLSGCSSLNEVTSPTFEDGGEITFTAYAGPTVENWNGLARNVDCLNETNYRKLSEAGFNKVIALYEGAASETSSLDTTIENRSQKAEEHATKALDLAGRFNLEYYVRDWSFYGLTQPSGYYFPKGINSKEAVESVIGKIFPDDVEYVHHSAYAGNFCYDEPTYDELENVSWEVDSYLDRMAELGAHGEPLVNLLPIYANSDYHMSGHTYSEYIDRYIQLVGSKIGYVSYDFYPFLSSDDGSYLRTQYLLNLQIVAEACKRNNLTPRGFVQAVGDYTGLRDITSIADFRFQVYTSLAFGFNNLTYYEYSGTKSQNEGQFALFNFMDGTYNYTYDLAKKVNNEVHAFEKAITSYRYDNVLYRNSNELYDNQNFANLIKSTSEHDRVAILNSSEDTLLTAFKHTETEDDAFMLVNFTDPYENKSDEVVLCFQNASALLMYRFGEKMVVRLPSDGEYTFKLSPGEGRFIVPIK